MKLTKEKLDGLEKRWQNWCGCFADFLIDELNREREAADKRNEAELVELEAENAKLRKVVEAAKELSISAERTLGLMSCKKPNCLRPFCKMDCALEELEQTK